MAGDAQHDAHAEGKRAEEAEAEAAIKWGGVSCAGLVARVRG